MTAIDQMVRLHRWACEEKRRTLEDLLRLAERLRADLLRLDSAPPGSGRLEGDATAARRRKLERTIADIEQAVERARQALAGAEQELARIERKREEGGTPDKAQRKAPVRARRSAGTRSPR